MLRTPLAIALLIMPVASFGAGDAEKGEKLFNALPNNNGQTVLGSVPTCLSCHNHGIEIFNSPKSIIKDLKSLEAQVRFCTTKKGPDWYDPALQDVVSYLNKQFYKFPTPE